MSLPGGLLVPNSILQRLTQSNTIKGERNCKLYMSKINGKLKTVLIYLYTIHIKWEKKGGKKKGHNCSKFILSPIHGKIIGVSCENKFHYGVFRV